jgi:carbamoyltransferase
MPSVLGIHNGHHASCAVVKDGILVAAIEQERITSIKADGTNYLSNNLPVEKCLAIAGLQLSEIDLIISSFQAIGPGGVGLIQPFFEPGFSLFNPFDKRHFVISHHYAHAISAFSTSGFQKSAVIVSDLAGSTTLDGKDFILSFPEYYQKWTNFSSKRQQTKTECLSVYNAAPRVMKLLYREFCMPHCSPEIFICSPASLYDNLSRFIFNREDAHGELMALASLATKKDMLQSGINAADIFEYTKKSSITFKNDWQHKVVYKKRTLDYVPVAGVVQEAFEMILLQYAVMAKKITKLDCLSAAGGVFLNIKANSLIEKAGIFSRYHVPSSPHDAGIAIGCAFHGWNIISEQRNIPVIINDKKATDRIGSTYAVPVIKKLLKRFNHLCSWQENITPNDVSELITAGNIVARFSGPAEFGPRALGGRSLLASPLLAESKDKMNEIKGRQEWRPVAPMVIKEKVNIFFEGSDDSPYMNQLHIIRPKHRKYLKAVLHFDNSARVQTLTREEDIFLYEVLLALESATGYPILVNTSFNGKGEPIVETPEKAIDFLLNNPLVDFLLIGNILVRRIDQPEWKCTKLAPDCIISIITISSVRRYILLRKTKTMEISEETFAVIKKLPFLTGKKLSQNVLSELFQAALLQFLIKQ